MDFKYGRLKAPADSTGYTTVSVPCRGARGVLFGFKGSGGATTAWGTSFGEAKITNPGSGAQGLALLPTNSNGAGVIGAPTGAVTLANTWMMWNGLAAASAANLPPVPIMWPYCAFNITTAGTLLQLEIWVSVFFDKSFKEDRALATWDEAYWQSILV